MPCSWLVSITSACGVPSLSTVTFAIVASPSASNACRPLLASSRTTPLMSVTTSPGIKPSASKVWRSRPGWTRKPVTLPWSTFGESRMMSVSRPAFWLITLRSVSLPAGGAAATGGAEHLLRQTQRLEPVAAVQQDPIPVNRVQRRAAPGVDRLADVVGLVLAAVRGNDRFAARVAFACREDTLQVEAQRGVGRVSDVLDDGLRVLSRFAPGMR